MGADERKRTTQGCSGLGQHPSGPVVVSGPQSHGAPEGVAVHTVEA